MEIDPDLDVSRRKRAMPLPSSSESQGVSKAKKALANVSTFPRDSSFSTETGKVLYSSSDNPPYIVHVYSSNEDSMNPIHPLLISKILSRLHIRI